jgi:hypothetical protein
MPVQILGYPEVIKRSGHAKIIYQQAEKSR